MKLDLFMKSICGVKMWCKVYWKMKFMKTNEISVAWTEWSDSKRTVTVHSLLYRVYEFTSFVCNKFILGLNCSGDTFFPNPGITIGCLTECEHHVVEERTLNVCTSMLFSLMFEHKLSPDLLLLKQTLPLFLRKVEFHLCQH